jgi:hypothetical protein
VAAGSLGYTRILIDTEGNETVQSLLTCEYGAEYEGEATPDSFVNKVYSINKDQVNLREFNGQGTYRIAYPTVIEKVDDKDVETLAAFPQVETSYAGVIEQPIVLGVDAMRLQYQPELVNQAQDAYLPETILDVSLIWRSRDVIDVNVFLAYDAESKFANPDGSGLPYIAIGTNSESYSVAYRANADGSEEGQFTFYWSGVTFVDGPVENSLALQKNAAENLREDVAAEVGSNVSYTPYTAKELSALGSDDGAGISEEKCGFFDRGNETDDGIDCDAIAYLSYRGLVTASIREERDGVYVIRYIDGTWQVLGG